MIHFFLIYPTYDCMLPLTENSTVKIWKCLHVRLDLLFKIYAILHIKITCLGLTHQIYSQAALMHNHKLPRPLTYRTADPAVLTRFYIQI